jgi:hypothetical protein
MEPKEIEGLIKKVSLETSYAIVNRLKEIINPTLEDMIKKQLEPLNIDRTKYLETQLSLADGLLSKINNTFTGWLAIKIAKWQIDKPIRKAEKEKAKLEKKKIKLEANKLRLLLEKNDEQKRIKN